MQALESSWHTNNKIPVYNIYSSNLRLPITLVTPPIIPNHSHTQATCWVWEVWFFCRWGKGRFKLKLAHGPTKLRPCCLCLVLLFKQCVCDVLVAQLCPTLCDSVDCRPPGFSVHGILQARILEWVAVPPSRGSSQPRDRTQEFCIAGRFFTV